MGYITIPGAGTGGKKVSQSHLNLRDQRGGKNGSPGEN